MYPADLSTFFNTFNEKKKYINLKTRLYLFCDLLTLKSKRDQNLLNRPALLSCHTPEDVRLSCKTQKFVVSCICSGVDEFAGSYT